MRLNNFKAGNIPGSTKDGLIWKQASLGIFIDEEVIREFYGDQIAIYYAWMNYFLKWIAAPAAFGVTFRTANYFLYEDMSKSPFNAAFSIGMAFWGILFATNWKRN